MHTITSNCKVRSDHRLLEKLHAISYTTTGKGWGGGDISITYIGTNHASVTMAFKCSFLGNQTE